MSAYPKVDLGTVFKGSPNGKIVKAQGGQRELRPHDVAIDIAYSGLCYTCLLYTSPSPRDRG